MWWLIAYIIIMLFSASSFAVYFYKRGDQWDTLFDACSLAFVVSLVWPISWLFLFFMRHVQTQLRKSGEDI